MAFYTVNGQRVYAREEGPTDAQVALLIHCWSGSWFALSPVLPLLSHRFSCIAIDLPGYGNSPAPNTPITIPYYADLLADLVRQVTDQPVVLVGHSMGGMISLTMALRHPELIDRMVLLCPTITGNLSILINAVYRPLALLEQSAVAGKLMEVLDPHMVTLTDSFMRPASFSDRTDISEKDYERIRADARRPGQGRVRAQSYRAMRANDLSGRLKEISTPTMLLWGAEDNTVPLRDAAVVADEWPTADLRIIPKAGHWPQFETPDVTKRYIASYLGLPVVSSRLDDASTPAEAVRDAAAFLAHSDIGNGLNLNQRARLSGQLRLRIFRPGDSLVEAQDASNDLYLVREGNVEVWSDPAAFGRPAMAERLAIFQPGQIVGELSLLDGGRRSADLRAGPNGAKTLILKRERLQALCVDDPAIGQQVLWNIATALALRLRLTNARQEMLPRDDDSPLEREHAAL